MKNFGGHFNPSACWQATSTSHQPAAATSRSPRRSRLAPAAPPSMTWYARRSRPRRSLLSQWQPGGSSTYTAALTCTSTHAHTHAHAHAHPPTTLPPPHGVTPPHGVRAPTKGNDHSTPNTEHNIMPKAPINTPKSPNLPTLDKTARTKPNHATS